MNNIITIDSLTTNEVEGTGVFDDLMRSVKAHLEDQLAKGNITEVNFSQVYLGALTAVLSESSRFLLAKDEQNLKHELMDHQVEAAGIQTSILKEDFTLKQLEVNIARRAKCKLIAEIKLIEAQTLQITQTTYNSTIEAEALVNRDLKVQHETELVVARTRTEYAQTHDQVNSESVGGVIGRQTALYQNQSEGFIRTSEQAAARIMADNLAVQANTGITPAWELTGFTVANAETVIGALVTGTTPPTRVTTGNATSFTATAITEDVLTKTLVGCSTDTPTL